MLENIKNNLFQWDEKHKWSKDGDEWSGQAKLCEIPYEEWKASLIAHLITPNIHPDSVVLEIAPGHGRWSEHLIAGARHVTLVDLSAKCIEFCRNRFADKANVDCFLTNGLRLPHHCTGAIDFLWSYDSFVHMDETVIGNYVAEMQRVLKHGGKAVIHHADITDLDLHRQEEHPGWRSRVNAALIRDIVERNGLAVADQFTFWDQEKSIGVPRFGDKITVIVKP